MNPKQNGSESAAIENQTLTQNPITTNLKALNSMPSILPLHVGLCSGFGQFHSTSNRIAPKAYEPITLSKIYELLSEPEQIEKAKARWFIPSNLMSREHAEQREHGEFYALWADLDDVGVQGRTFSEVSSLVKDVVDSECWIYTSRSATRCLPKSRVIVPLAGLVTGEQFVLMQRVLNERLRAQGIEPDPVNERPGQLCYLPNRGDFYDWVTHAGGLLSVDDWSGDVVKQLDIERKDQEDLQSKREQARLKAAKRVQTGQLSPIDAYNEAYSVELMLDSYGYLRKGKRWSSPNSKTGSAGVSLTRDGRKWLSRHGSDKGIGRPTENGTMGDSFDLFVYYDHQGDRDAALKAAGEMFHNERGVSLTKQNQIEYMSSRAVGQASEDFNDMGDPRPDPDGQPLDFSRFSLKGQSHDMEARMLDEKYVLGRMAILGQATVFYAKPNAGKTLLTLWLITRAIDQGEIKGDNVYYINADDNYRGLTHKLKLAEKYGFHMLAPGYNEFQAQHLVVYLNEMVKAEQARGKVLILDTVKKFTDIMDKTKNSKFNESVRQFVSHGGTVIMLAHVNKHRDAENKVVFSGTSDLVDDADCAYTLDIVTEDFAKTRTVKFENIKSRGDVASEAVYKYDATDGLSYQGRLESISSVSDEERQEAERQRAADAKYQRNAEAVEVIREVLRDGLAKKTEIIHEAAERSGISKQKIRRALHEHTGSNIGELQYWYLKVEDKNAHVYRLNLSA